MVDKKYTANTNYQLLHLIVKIGRWGMGYHPKSANHWHWALHTDQYWTHF